MRQGDELGVTLYWRAPQPLDTDYKVFVHVVREGRVGRAARRRAGSWRLYNLTLARRRSHHGPASDSNPRGSAETGSSSVVVGLYDPATGARARLAQGGN